MSSRLLARAHRYRPTGHVDPRLYELTALAALIGLAVVVGLLSVDAPLLLVGAVAFVGFAALVAKRPDTATLALLVLLYSNAPVVVTRNLGLPMIVSLALPALLLAPLAHHTLIMNRPLRLGVAGPILVVLAVVYVASALTAADWSTAAMATLNYLANGVALYLLIVNVLRSAQAVRRAALVIVGVAGGLGALALVHSIIGLWPGTRAWGFTELVRGDLLAPVDWEQYFSVNYPDSELRAAGPIGEANFFAFILLVAIPYAIAFAIAPTARLERIVSLLAGPFIVAGVVVTYSRGAAVVAGLVAVMLAVTGLIPRRTLVGLVGGAAALLLAVPAFAERFVRLASAPLLWGGARDEVADAALTGRYSEMISALHAWADHPLLGVGPGLFPDNYQRYARELGFMVHDGPREAHNLYLDFASQLGTAGLLVLLVLLLVLTRRLLAVRRIVVDPADRAFTVAAIAVVGVIAVNGMFLHLAFERYLWVHVAIVSAWCLEARRVSREPTPDAQVDPLARQIGAVTW